MFRSLCGRDYRIWTAGTFVSNVGTWMQNVAQDWLVLTVLTLHSAAAVGVVTALQFGPQVVLLPLTGFAADRFERRRVLIATQSALALIAVAQAALILSGRMTLWHLYGFALAAGIATAFDTPTRQAFIAELVKEEDLTNAVALNSTVIALARTVGPSIAGLSIAAAGPGWAFLWNGLSFGAVLGSLFLLRHRTPPGEARSVPATGARLMAAWHRAWGDRSTRAVLFTLALIGTFGLNFPIFISTMAVRVFHTGPDAFGALSSMLAVGTIGGALIAAARKRPGMRSLTVGCGLFGLGCVAAALAPSYWSFAAALLVMGAAALTFQNATSILLQVAVEPWMRGRILALRLAIILGGLPVGAPVIGWVADRFGPRWALAIGALAGLVAAALGAAEVRRSRSARSSRA